MKTILFSLFALLLTQVCLRAQAVKLYEDGHSYLRTFPGAPTTFEELFFYPDERVLRVQWNEDAGVHVITLQRWRMVGDELQMQSGVGPKGGTPTSCLAMVFEFIDGADLVATWNVDWSPRGGRNFSTSLKGYNLTYKLTDAPKAPNAMKSTEAKASSDFTTFRVGHEFIVRKAYPDNGWWAVPALSDRQTD